MPRDGLAGAPPSMLADARRVLVMRPDNAGDVVLAGPTVRALRGHLSDAELVLLASPSGAQVAPLLPWIDRVEVARVLWQDATGRLPFDPGREIAFVDRLRAGGFDAAFVLTSFSQTPYAAAYAAYLAGIPIRVGHAPAFGGGVLSHPVPGPAPVHQAERNLHLLPPLGVPVPDAGLRLEVPEEAAGRVTAILTAHGVAEGEPIVVAPGASCSARRYAPERFASAAATAARATGRPVVVIGSEREADLAAPVLAANPTAVDLVGRTSVVEAAAVVERAAMVLANDSLALHLADAFGRPVVATFAGTDREEEWGPRRSQHVLLREPTACAPCRRFTCPFDGHPCLDIPPEAVAAAATALLATVPSPREVAWAV